MSTIAVKSKRNGFSTISITCIGHPAIVYHIPIDSLLRDGLVKFTNVGTLAFTHKYIKVNFEGTIYIFGPLQKQGYSAGSKCPVRFEIEGKAQESVDKRDIVGGGTIIIGGGAVNNARILSALLPNVKINLHLGIGPGLAKRIIRGIVPNANNIILYPTWTLPPLYIEIDLSPHIADSVVLKPKLPIANHIYTPRIEPGNFLVINTIYDPVLFFCSMDMLGVCCPGVIALTEPMFSSTMFSQKERQYYQKIHRGPCPYKTKGDFSVNSSFSKANAIVVNEMEAEQLCARMQNTIQHTIQNFVLCLYEEKLKYPLSSTRIYLTLGQFGCLMIGRNFTLHYCYAHPDQLTEFGIKKHTYALGDAFTAGVSMVEAVEKLSGKVLPEKTIISIGVAVSTATFLHGYEGLNLRKVENIIRTGCIKYASFKSMKELVCLNAFSHRFENLSWERLLEVPSKRVEVKLLSTFFKSLEEAIK
jgi:hypothetical protein